MDYRYYRGDGPKLSDKWKKFIHLLRYVGTAMMVLGLVIVWLEVLHVIESTYAWNFISAAMMVMGPILVIIGMAWNSMIDRS